MDKVRMGCIALVVVPIIGGLLLGPPEKTEAEKARDAKIAAQVDAEFAVKAILRDPDSAEFKHLRPGVCGYVNARNGFGGMNGYQRFVIVDGSAIVETRLNQAAFHKAWQVDCLWPVPTATARH